MNKFMLGLCLLMTLSGFSAWAVRDDIAFGEPKTDAAKSEDKCRPCYELPEGCPKQKISKQCKAFDETKPGYFSGIDSQCGLPAGTAEGFAMIETGGTCNPSLKNKFGYTGMFQFNTASCPKGNLYDLGVQASCMCDYTANTRRAYAKATGGQSPSSGMYYMFHQQGSCGFKLAMGGNQRAVDVVAACVQGTKSSPMSYAMKAISGNLAGSLRAMGLNASNVTAQQFANGWMSRFGDSTKPAAKNNACATDGTTPDTTAGAPGGTPGVGDMTSAFTSMMNQSGMPFSPSMIQSLMGTSIGQLFPGMLSYNPQYDNDNASDDDTPTEQPETVNVVTNSDGTVKVTVQNDSDNSTSYTVNHGQQLWKCNGVYQVVSADRETAMTAKGCSKVAESAALPTPVVTTPAPTPTPTTTAPDENVGGIQQ